MTADAQSNVPAMETVTVTSALPFDLGLGVQPSSTFRISVITMTGAAIVIADVVAADTIGSIKERVFAANRKLPVRRQRIVHRPGPRGMEPLADDETLGGAGVAQDGSAALDVLLVELTESEAAELGLRLLEAAKNGLTNDTLSLLEEGANIEFKDMNNGDSALMCAVRNGRTDCVRLLIDSGADMEAKGMHGYTALMIAALNGHVECARLLIVFGANLDAKNESGGTALMYAALNGHTQCARLLVDSGACRDAAAGQFWGR